MVGGGDTALETAIAIAACGGRVTLSYRKKEFARPKPENVEKLQMLMKNPEAEVMVENPTSERVTTAANSRMRGANKPGCVQLRMETTVQKIEPSTVTLRDAAGKSLALPNDVVFTMLGREAPLDFFRRSRLAIRGEWVAKTWILFLLWFAFCSFLYIWKASSHLNQVFEQQNWFPFNVPGWLHGLGGAIATAAADPRTFLGTLTIDLAQPGFYYSIGYTVLMVGFGLRRIRRRKTPYVRLQTYSLMGFQVFPLFLLPYIVLPLMGHNGWFDSGVLKSYRGPSISCGELRPRPRILARVWIRAGMAAVYLERFHVAADVVVAGDFAGANLCHYPPDCMAMGQGSILRLGVFVRRAGGDDG